MLVVKKAMKVLDFP